MFKKTNKYADLCDEKLVELYILGDDKAFGELYHRYSKRLYYYFLKMNTGDYELAADLTQELFTKILIKVKQFDLNKKFSSWIYASAYNQMKNIYASKNSNIKFESIDDNYTDDYCFDAVDNIDLSLFIERLDMFLSKMSFENRNTFLLRYKEEYSINDIAEITGVPAGTVKSRLFYTLKKLNLSLAEFKPI